MLLFRASLIILLNLALDLTTALAQSENYKTLFQNLYEQFNNHEYEPSEIMLDKSNCVPGGMTWRSAKDKGV